MLKMTLIVSEGGHFGIYKISAPINKKLLA